jgi:tetratricopeptide (TPR) repeat protein
MRLLPVLAILCMLPATAASYAPRADLDAGRYLKALSDAEDILKRDPRSALAWAAKSQALTALLRMTEAMDAAEKALELQPGLADALMARGLARIGSAVQQRNLSSIANAAASLEDLRRAVQADPTLLTAWVSLGVGYELLPGILGGSTRKALDCAQSLKRVSQARGEMLQGTVLSMEGRWPEAEACFKRALAAGPRDPEIVYAYLDALGSTETRKVLGDAETRRRQAQEAKRLLPGSKGRARAMEAICDALLDANQGEEAWRNAKDALAGADAPSLIRLQLGKVAARAGIHQEEGLAFLNQVLREPIEGGSGGYGAAHWRRGQILRGLGRKAEAREAAQAALRVDPRDPKPARLLKELQ